MLSSCVPLPVHLAVIFEEAVSHTDNYPPHEEIFAPTIAPRDRVNTRISKNSRADGHACDFERLFGTRGQVCCDRSPVTESNELHSTLHRIFPA
ncbi:hypothetical protein CEE69_10040 [Rhodopirellula bahusiensis]|uniref:Uncharacterized protein n=1 Tax=Rhodopirellula bahusiensis TaxID=2014065 RepID=A0A2G1W8J1_9BACT|nr:hypothetical protein CEE69_10040 [Rhodopirellula bahusiensis]